MRKFINLIFIILGILSLTLGVVGTVVPILPTTPFILLSVALFGVGSPKFHSWLLGTKLYQNYVEASISKKGMTKTRKCKIIITISCFFGVGIFFSPGMYVKLTIAIILLVHLYIFLFKVPTIKENKVSEREKENVQ